VLFREDIEDKLDYLKNPSQDFKNYFLGFYEYLERLEGKTRKCLFFYVKYSKITVWKETNLKILSFVRIIIELTPTIETGVQKQVAVVKKENSGLIKELSDKLGPAIINSIKGLKGKYQLLGEIPG
jgi:hypothetical protein